MRRLTLSFAIFLAILPASLSAATLAEFFVAAAPNADPKVMSMAAKAITCAKQRNQGASDYVSIIDYSRPSTESRFWLFDIKKGQLLYEELVAHGKNTGENYARNFSNRHGTKQSSLGLFRTGTSYYGRNGYTVRLHGLEPKFNDQALDRLIVLHGAWYVSSAFAKKYGRLGRSWGCPVLRPEVTKEVIDYIKEGQLVFIYFPDKNWLEHSTFLSCNS